MGSKQGFTLVEMLIALLVLAFIMATVSQSAATGLRLWERGEASRSNLEMRQTVHLLRQSARRVRVSEQDAFIGQRDFLEFHAIPPSEALGYHPVAVSLSANGVLTIGDQVESRSLGSVAGIRYRDPDGEWHESWLGRDDRPSWVQIQLEHYSENSMLIRVNSY